jgi:hypothetical protein
VPLQGLYEISVWIAWYWAQPDKAKARRAVLFVLLLIVLVALLIWAGWIYGWPVVRQYWHRS